MENQTEKEKKIDEKLEQGLNDLDELLQEELKQEKVTPKINVVEKKEKPSKQKKTESSENISAIKTQSEIIKDLINKGNAEYHARKFTEAVVSYQKVLELQPKNLEALFNLSVLYLERNEQELAQKKIEEVLEIKPNDFKSLCNLGGIYYKMGRLRDAYDTLNKAISINPNDINSLQNLKIIEKKIMYSKK